MSDRLLVLERPSIMMETKYSTLQDISPAHYVFHDNIITVRVITISHCNVIDKY